MKTILTLEIVAPNFYAEVRKALDIPFMLAEGTKVQLESILDNHPNVGKYREYLSDDALATGIYTITDVVYQPQKQMMLLRACEYCETSEEAKSVVGQLVYGYEFEPLEEQEDAEEKL